MKKFGYEVEESMINTGLSYNHKWSILFENGYEASIIRGPQTYGGMQGLYELAVVYNGHLVYDTPITEDVIGYLEEREVHDVLNKIRDLPERQEAQK